MILACDVATTTGFAWGNIGETPKWNVVNFSGKSGTGEVLAKFRFYLMDRILVLKPEILVFESPFIPVARAPRFAKAGTGIAAVSGPPPMNALTLRRLLAMTGLVEEIAFERGIKCREATVLDITRFFTGTTRHGGRANKKAATIEACRRLGWVTVSDDAADALSLWCYAEHIIAPQIAARRAAGARLELPLHGTLADPVRDRIGRGTSAI
jgi:crossover junction endodeoxyribonuclease RuvC